MVVDVCQMHYPKFPNNILDMESQINDIAVIRPSFPNLSGFRKFIFNIRNMVSILVCHLVLLLRI